jgi:hypothetical protein
VGNNNKNLAARLFTFRQASVAVDESDALVDDNGDALVGQLLVGQGVAGVEGHRFEILPKHVALFLVAQLKKSRF